MSIVRRVSLLVIVAALAFLTAFLARRRAAVRPPSVARAATADSLPDSTKLSAIGLAPGRQLIAYVIGSSRCASCRGADLKTAVGTLRSVLRRSHAKDFRSISLVGVAINTDVTEGLAYLSSIGLTSFDEIGVGDGWQNL